MKPLMEEKVFKDPVHKYIYVQEPLIWELINAREFQRLRRIKQMGTSFFTFHGAEHSRFSHSLGVYEITRKIIAQFQRHGLVHWPREETWLSLCAALLHDIGHGPFSHSIENAWRMHHEQWSRAIVLGETEVNRILRRADERLPERVASVIDKTYDNHIVTSLITSQLDADRMDYLLRDAYYTGVNYGTFDLERILRVMRPHEGQIVIKESGMHAVEDYLMSRYQMYWQVYFHPVTRSSEIVLEKLLQRARQLYDEGYSFRFLPAPLPQLFKDALTVADYLLLDEPYMQMVMMQWTNEQDRTLADLCDRFLNRRLFDYVSTDRIEQQAIADMEMQLRDRGLDPAHYMQVDVPTHLPYDVYSPLDQQGKQPIYIIDERDELIEISTRSDVVRSISSRRAGTPLLYYPADFVTLPSN